MVDQKQRGKNYDTKFRNNQTYGNSKRTGDAVEQVGDDEGLDAEIALGQAQTKAGGGACLDWADYEQKQKTSPASSSPERHDCLMDKNSNGEAQHLTAVLLEANSKALLTDEDIADGDVGAADDGDDRDGYDGSHTNVDTNFTNLRC